MSDLSAFLNEQMNNPGDISKLENGLRNPTIQLLKRIADSMNMTLKIEFIPKQQNNKKKI